MSGTAAEHEWWPVRGWSYRRSLASRVTLLTTFAVGLAVAVVALAVYVTVRVQLQSTLDESLLERAQSAAEGGALAELSEARIPSWMLGAADVRILFITEDREARSADNLPAIRLGDPELAVAAGEAASSLRTINGPGERYRVVAVPVPTEPGQALVVAQSLQGQDAVLGKLGLVMLLVGGAGVLTAGLAGWAVARSGLRPVRRLTDAVEEIARTEELQPLTIEGDDEIARLATAFNHMLVALDSSRDRQRQLVADAGHELRTPLTSLRTNVDLLAQAESMGGLLPPEARAELLDDLRAQTEELTTLIGDLVELARDEVPAHVVAPVDVAEVVDRSLARVRRRAPGITYEVHLEPWWVVGESAALERAVTNLLDNASKWSPVRGTVRVELRHGVLTVDDEGPGIAPEDRPHVFERFWRASESRTMPGSGLGLAIVHQVVTRHSGSVRVDESPGGGARMEVQLPGASSSRPFGGPEGADGALAPYSPAATSPSQL